MGRADLSLGTRTVFGITLLFGLLATGMTGLLQARFDELSLHVETQRVRNLAEITAAASAPGLDFGDEELIAERLALLEGPSGAQWATVFSEDGRRLATWGDPPVVVAPPQKVAVSTASMTADTLRVVAPVTGRAGSRGQLVAAFSLTELEALRADNRTTVWALVLVMYGLAFLMSLGLASWLVRPLGPLTKAAQGIRDGTIDLEELARSADTVSGYRRDEAMVLHHALAMMADRVGQQMQEVTDAWRAAEEAGEAAVEESRAKSRFLANMSHELRTPLNAIVGYADMLDDDLDDMERDEVRGDLRRIRQASRHLLSLISNILDLSKVEAGRMELFCEPIDVRTVVEEAVAAVAPLLSGRDVVVRSSVGVDITRMHGDLTKLRQCLLNLLSNAAKFTEHGQIWVRVRALGDDQLRFEVQDTGVGMKPEQLQRVFEEFGQADASTTRRYGGTGLGLSLTRHLVHLMGGTIEVHSRFGEGSVFQITVPLELEVSASPQRPGLSEGSSPRLIAWQNAPASAGSTPEPPHAAAS